MKKYLFTIIFATALFSIGQAQSFHLGIKAGANLNKISGESFNSGFDFGYHAGVFAELGLGKKFAIQPEVLFVQTKTDTTNNFSSVYQSSNFSHATLNYLSIPILASYKLSKILAIQAGPQYGILLNRSENLVHNGQDAFKQGDFSLVAGLQLHILSLRIYGRYAIGLDNVYNVNNQNKWTSQTIQLGVGYAFL